MHTDYFSAMNSLFQIYELMREQADPARDEVKRQLAESYSEVQQRALHCGHSDAG